MPLVIIPAHCSRHRGPKPCQTVNHLIINADYFGLLQSVNRAILDLHRMEVLTNTPLMAGAGETDHTISRYPFGRSYKQQVPALRRLERTPSSLINEEEGEAEDDFQDLLATFVIREIGYGLSASEPASIVNDNAISGINCAQAPLLRAATAIAWSRELSFCY